MDDPRIIEPQRIKPLSNALADLPDSYPEIRFQLMAISEEFRRQCAKALEPMINRFVQSKKPKSREEYRQLARMVDDAARLLGLCVVFDGRPGVLCATGADPSTGKKAGFAVLLHGEKGRRPIKEKLDAESPWFSLIAAPPNMEDYLRPLREAAHLMGRR